ncbi:hypothetical protein BG011_007793 [Mortierella polycephala]|uniref:TM2 domain-containing protein n=1 Tax=Mortierella polycephala TaxID=41804 RepID=A0A9P6TXR8_9FUNG|nr:hypothetical protein BG011_007793 [Mortierella polycephala]
MAPTHNPGGRDRDQEAQPLLNGQPAANQDDISIFHRTCRHVIHHRIKYCIAWILGFLVTITIVLLLVKIPHHRSGHGKDPSDFSGAMMRPGKDVCDSDRSYPIAIILSIIFGYFGIDRFYLGYIVTGLLKFITGPCIKDEMDATKRVPVGK